MIQIASTRTGLATVPVPSSVVRSNTVISAFYCRLRPE